MVERRAYSHANRLGYPSPCPSRLQTIDTMPLDAQHRVNVDRLQQHERLQRREAATAGSVADGAHRQQMEEERAQTRRLLDLAMQARDTEYDGMTRQRMADIDRFQQQLQTALLGAAHEGELLEEQQQGGMLMDAAVLSMNIQRRVLTQKRDADVDRLNSQILSERGASSTAAADAATAIPCSVAGLQGRHRTELQQIHTDRDGQLRRAQAAAQTQIDAAVDDRDTAITDHNDAVEDRDATNDLVQATHLVSKFTRAENERHRAERDSARASLSASSAQLEHVRQNLGESSNKLQVLKRERTQAVDQKEDRDVMLAIQDGRAEQRIGSLEKAVLVEGAARARERSGMTRAVGLLGRLLGRGGEGEGDRDGQERERERDGQDEGGVGSEDEVARVVAQVQDVLDEVLIGPMAGGFPDE
ncbi:hypothetical protein K491DRAFT_740446 [Lophiostoma macrostomum CBS 122681]|uniref:Uncharacterized protein n=1 Tax=Lophiostoma macrostomum CBS 122681 TaxID=1314788 RepID=A0A6A6SLK8_9PLEO|nr:hypothetical protein K491DRAFT_740446 [Lophiostoma macrostomum CBS 122681]